MHPKMWANEYRTTVVCIDSYKDRVPAGRFYNRYCPDGVQFQSTVDFLRKIEDMLDRMQFPQPFDRVRTFTESTVVESEALTGIHPKEGACGTFAVKVLFRQNASWQGSIAWLEGKREESFRSVLELLLLIDSAVSGVEA